MLKLQFLGAAETVTGSKTLVEYNKNKYLIDCGLYQGPKEIRERNWNKIEIASQIKSVILTHAHIDHSGYLPKFIKDGFRGPVFCTEATADLCRILLPDAGFLQEEDARFANMKKYSKHSPALPLYTQQDAIQSLEHLAPRASNEWIELEKGLSFRFIRSGHILGSAFVQLNYSNHAGSKILTFSGDLGNGRSLILKEPTQITETDELVLESTYGDRAQNVNHEFDSLRDIIKKVLGRRGTLVIPAFAVGRTQEILYMIHLLEQKGEIEKYDVYVDSPMALDATEIYAKYSDELKPEIRMSREYSPIKCSRFTAVRTADESMMLCMNDDPKIVISAAGMLTGGRIMHHLKMRLPHEKNGVLFIGYQLPGTKGHLLKSGLNSINIHHEKVDVEAEIFSLESLSAHADTNDLVRWVSGFHKKPQKIYLNHGEMISLEALEYRLTKQLQLNAVIARPNTEYVL